VRDYAGDDPLEPWLRLVKWTQEHLGGGSKAELQKTLETCTKELLRTNKYLSDVRFLRLWIQYVSHANEYSVQVPCTYDISHVYNWDLLYIYRL